MKKASPVIMFALIVSVFINILTIGTLLLNSDKVENVPQKNSDTKDYTKEYCVSLSLEAERRTNNCLLEGLNEMYGIGYEEKLKDGGSCFFTISTGYCIQDSVVEPYLKEMRESCSKSFPKREDIFADCLSKVP